MVYDFIKYINVKYINYILELKVIRTVYETDITNASV